VTAVGVVALVNPICGVAGMGVVPLVTGVGVVAGVRRFVHLVSVGVRANTPGEYTGNGANSS
jgi:hypothetical protein